MAAQPGSFCGGLRAVTPHRQLLETSTRMKNKVWTILLTPVCRGAEMPTVLTPEEIDRIRRHYIVECELAERLRNSTREQRQHLYSEVYDELFQRVPDQSQVAAKLDPASRRKQIHKQLQLIRPWLSGEKNFLEVGGGDCELSMAVAHFVKHAYALEVSKNISPDNASEDNFHLIYTDGLTVPLDACTIDVAFSDQVLEHIHPDDVLDQLEAVRNTLRPGGLYICITPNKLCGPHDISMYFDEEPKGLHLREYSNGDLIHIFRRAGFKKFRCLVSYESAAVPFLLPLGPFLCFERLCAALPHKYRRTLAKALLAIKFVAIV